VKSLVEEDFLRADPQYAAYMQRVRARWIPFLVCEETTFMSPQIQLKISTSLAQDATIRLQLGDAIRAIYEVISFPEGGEPDWERMKKVFLPNARLTRITPEGVDCFDLETFQAMALEMLDRGIYTSFFEHELIRRVNMFGAFAQVLSAYETKTCPDASYFLARGVNSIQLLRERDSWRVLSLLWDEEAENVPFNLEHIFAGEITRG